MQGHAVTASRPVIAIATAIAGSRGRKDRNATVAEVERTLGLALGAGIPKAQVARAASFLVQAVQPLLDEGSVDAPRILTALRSPNPLREPRIATAFADALLEVEKVTLATDMTWRNVLRSEAIDTVGI